MAIRLSARRVEPLENLGTPTLVEVGHDILLRWAWWSFARRFLRHARPRRRFTVAERVSERVVALGVDQRAHGVHCVIEIPRFASPLDFLTAFVDGRDQ